MIVCIGIATAAAVIAVVAAWFGVDIWQRKKESRGRVLRAFHQVILAAPTPEARRSRFFIIRGGLSTALGACMGRIAASTWWQRSHPALITSGATMLAAVAALVVVQVGRPLPDLPAVPPAVLVPTPPHWGTAPSGPVGTTTPTPVSSPSVFVPHLPRADDPPAQPTDPLLALGGSTPTPSAGSPAGTTSPADSAPPTTPTSPTAPTTSPPPSTTAGEPSSQPAGSGGRCLVRVGIGAAHVGVCLRGT